MPGILEQLNDRRAYFQELREKGDGKYVEEMKSSTERLARQVGVTQERGSNRVFSAVREQARDAQGRFRAQTEEEKKNRQAQLALGGRQVEQTKMLGYNLGNNIRTLQTGMVGILNEILDELKHQRQSMGGGGILGDLLGDMFDGRRGRGRGRGRGGRGARGRSGRLGRAARGARGAAGRAASRVAANGARVANAGRGVLSRVTGAGRGALNSARGAGSRALGWISQRGGALMESAGLRGASGAAPAAGRSLAGGVLRKAGTVGAIAAGGYTAYQALKDDTKTDGEKAQSVANAAGGTAAALALGAVGGKLGAAIGTAIAPGIGTAIGGAIGALGGGTLGYFGGEKITDKIGTSISDAVYASGMGDIIGRGAAAVMSPFSQEARDALVSDWKNNIAPSFAATIMPLKDALTGWGESLTKFSSDLWSKSKDTLEKGANLVFAPTRMAVRAVSAGARALEKTGSTGASIVSGARSVRDAAVSILPSSISSALGFVAAKYESGGKGVASISTGKGDKGGVSYGKHQLATKNGSMAQFLASKQGAAYASQFAGLKPGSKEFNDRYRQVVAADSSGFEKAQHDYIVDTHYNVQAKKVAKGSGLDINTRGRAVQEAVMSTSVQYGGSTDVINKALAGKDASKMSDADIVNAIQNYKAATVNTRFKSSSADVREGVAKRIERERADLLAINGQAGMKPVNVAKSSFANVTGDVSTTASKAGPKTATAAVMSPMMAAAPSSATVNKATVATPVVPVNPNTPPEATRVAVVADNTAKAAPTAPKPTSTATMARAPSRAGGIDLNDIPPFFVDLNMSSILLGRV